MSVTALLQREFIFITRWREEENRGLSIYFSPLLMDWLNLHRANSLTQNWIRDSESGAAVAAAAAYDEMEYPF